MGFTASARWPGSTSAEHMGTPLADASWTSFASCGRGAVTSSFLYHYARLIEILASLERIALIAR